MSNEQVSRETCIPDDCEIVEAIVPRGLVEPGEKLDLSTLADVRRLQGFMTDQYYRKPKAKVIPKKWVSLSEALYQANRIGSHWCEIDGERWYVQRNGQSWRDRGDGRWLVRYALGSDVPAYSWEDVLGYVRPLASDVTMRTEQSGVMVFVDEYGSKTATVEVMTDGT
jgi:hypothetical protein